MCCTFALQAGYVVGDVCGSADPLWRTILGGEVGHGAHKEGMVGAIGAAHTLHVLVCASRRYGFGPGCACTLAVVRVDGVEPVVFLRVALRVCLGHLPASDVCPYRSIGIACP